MKLLLDTTVLIDVLRKRGKRRKLLEELVSMGHELTTSVICVAEVYASLRPGEEIRAQLFLRDLSCYPVTDRIAVRAGVIKCERSRTGKTLSMTDMFIASTALEYNFSFMTDNLKDFPIEELKIYPLP